MMKTNIQIFIMLIAATFLACGKSDEGYEKIDRGTLSVSVDELFVEAEGATETVSVTSTKPVTLVPSKAWLTAVYDADVAADNLTINIEENSGEVERTAALLVKIDGGRLAEIVVRQKGKSSRPDVEEEGIHIQVSSYNIRYAAAADDTTGNGWNIRKTALANLIRTHNFDIVG